MNLIIKIFITAMIIFIGFLVFMTLKSRNGENVSTEISADFYFQPPALLLQSNQRLADLYAIAIALDKFKNEHRHYPITPNQGGDWSSVYSDNNKNLHWINGLAPAYIDPLPRDPRDSSNKLEQYAYQSDGAHYKLVAFYPPDCINVYSTFPKLVVTNGADCIGYGLWSKTSDWNSLLH